MGALASQLGSVTVSSVPDEESGEVGGLQNTLTNLGASIGTALAGAVLISVLTSSFLSGIANNPDVPESVVSQANVSLSGGAPFVSDAALEEQLAEADVPADVADDIVDTNASSRITGLQSRARRARDLRPRRVVLHPAHPHRAAPVRAGAQPRMTNHELASTGIALRPPLTQVWCLHLVELDDGHAPIAWKPPSTWTISPVVAGNQSDSSATTALADGLGVPDVPAQRRTLVPDRLEALEARGCSSPRPSGSDRRPRG